MSDPMNESHKNTQPIYLEKGYTITEFVCVIENIAYFKHINKNIIILGEGRYTM